MLCITTLVIFLVLLTYLIFRGISVKVELS